MPRLAPSVARIRSAVRSACADLSADSLILVACSGGPDSMALAAACAFIAPRAGHRCGLITVDHRLQAGSDRQAERVADWARETGFDPVEVATVTVGTAGGPEAAARDSRYAALRSAADRFDAATVLLGHTRDDQAETVLLALSRGAGPHGLSGMPSRRDRWRRPLLDVSRADTVAACDALELPVWNDPHNRAPEYARVRVREAMPHLTDALGVKLIANLARTARLVAEDNSALESLAARVRGRATVDGGLSVGELSSNPRALRTRVIRRWLLDGGVRAADLASVHIDTVDDLVVDWHGQRAVQLPGGLSVRRERDRLSLTTTV
ncbi:tRNA lysidine(34) synthetase TilS [Stackebrandtia endophytica]|nr:tRNA lysidine(34) synthetase TilS [Stackebrandtia endophytica]